MDQMSGEAGRAFGATPNISRLPARRAASRKPFVLGGTMIRPFTAGAFVCTLLAPSAQAQQVYATVSPGEMNAALLRQITEYMAKAVGTAEAVPVSVDAYWTSDFKIDGQPAEDWIHTADEPIPYASCPPDPIPGINYTMSVTQSETETISVSETTTVSMTDEVSASVEGIGAKLAMTLSEALTAGASTTKGTSTTVASQVSYGAVPVNTGVWLVPVQARLTYANVPYRMYVKPWHGKTRHPWSQEQYIQPFSQYYDYGNDSVYPPLLVKGSLNGSYLSRASVKVSPMSAAEVQQACAVPPFGAAKGLSGPRRGMPRPARFAPGTPSEPPQKR